MTLQPGARLGPYEILSALGAGGMGEVYKARDTRLDRTVAIKILPEAFAADPQFRERFDREARAISQLDHPNICTLHDVGEHAGTAYLIMQYLEGETLAHRLEQGALPLEQALKTAIEIASALDNAHRAGIVHRDLKPGNIMLTKSGAKLLDFGLAKSSGPVASGALSMLPTTPPNLTAQGTILGTFQYMAPEQLEGRETDARSDIFAFGAVVYEMLTGNRAFAGASQASVIAKILQSDPPPIAVSQPLTPHVVDHIVKRCLAKEPADRWQSAGDVMRELQWAVDEPPPAMQPHSQRRTWPWVVAAGAALAAAVVLGAWTVDRFRQLPAEPRAIRVQIDPPEGGQFVFGNTGGMALSPDGATIAYVVSVGGRNTLWLKSLESGVARAVPATDDAGYPFWSPDSRSIAFATNTRLKRVDVAGGNPLTICDTHGAFRGGTWNIDGFIVYGTTSSGLFRVAASGGAPTQVTMLDTGRGELFHGYPQMLTADRFLFWVRGDRADTTGIYAASLSDPRAHVLIMATEASALYATTANGHRYVLWTRTGTLLAQEFDAAGLKLIGQPHTVVDSVATAGITGQMLASASTAGMLLFSGANVVSQLTWFDRDGKRLGAVGEPAEYNTFRLSPDGRRAILARERPGGSDIWVVEVDRGGIATRLTSRGTSLSTYPLWSPDSQTVLFAADSPMNLFRKQLSGAAGSEERLWRAPHQQLAMDWSRDGRSLLVYDLSPDTGRDLLMMSMTSRDLTPKPYLRTPASEWWGRFDPEASPRWVAYQSDESGRYEVHVDRFPTPGARIPISTGGGQYPVWNPNGRELFYVSPELKLMAVSVMLGSDSVTPSAPHELFSLPAVDTGRNPYDISPDGQRFLVRATPNSRSTQSLTMILNWTAALDK